MLSLLPNIEMAKMRSLVPQSVAASLHRDALRLSDAAGDRQDLIVWTALGPKEISTRLSRKLRSRFRWLSPMESLTIWKAEPQLIEKFKQAKGSR